MDEVADMVKISTERMRHILHEHLSMKKMSVRWVLVLVLFQRNQMEFLRRFVTIGETWIHCYTPDSHRP